MEAPPRHVIFVDGECVLCNRLVHLLLCIDKRQVLTFATLQGETAQQAFVGDPAIERERSKISTLIYVRHFQSPQQKIYLRSTGALMALWDIGGVWRLLGILRLIPSPIRNLVYKFIASNRYRWFGKKEDTCLMPSSDEQSRFLD